MIRLGYSTASAESTAHVGMILLILRAVPTNSLLHRGIHTYYFPAELRLVLGK